MDVSAAWRTSVASAIDGNTVVLVTITVATWL